MSDSVEALGVIEKRQKLESETEEGTSHEDMDCGTNAAEAANVLYPPRRCDVALLTAASLGQVEEVKRIMDEEDGDPCFQVCQFFENLCRIYSNTNNGTCNQFIPGNQN